MSRFDISSLSEKRSTERGSEKTLVVQKPWPEVKRKEILTRPDSPQELPGRTSFEDSSTPMQTVSPLIAPRPLFASAGSISNFNFPSLDNLRDLGSHVNVSEIEFDTRKDLLKTPDDQGSRAPSPLAIPVLGERA
ncbi:uncharacterized protein N7483_009603 [Penicillium malachiteum]|uniref:uncharacterized protein n=1 Tax=Penicillium malachiteum TaxID=1324776 RepID=UPI0025477C84|nr:uncharacterized protein N7483_009603 [Penicillium malachiteum]KAJ5721669.1 hypothetical protein N7483_009603 [Penicillium malachiteum]